MNRVRLRRRSKVFTGQVGQSFGYGGPGIMYLFRTQRNARIELLCGVIACVIGAWVGLSGVEWAVLVLTIAGVLMAEGLNTAIEAAVDLACPRVDPLAKVAKDVVAGMVLLAAVAAAVVGVLVLGRGVWGKLAG